MFLIQLADLKIKVLHRHSYVKKLCRDYRLPEGDADFCVSATKEEILAEDAGGGFDKGYLESLALYRKIAEQIPDYQGFLMHGAVLDADGQGIALLAKSGVGKTTHARLWKELLGERMTVINGDKPLIRLKNGVPVAYGTPWAGKENLQKNAAVTLNSICFIERSEVNRCIALEPHEGFLRLMPQLYRPKSEAGRSKVFSLAGSVAETVSFYALQCNMDISAAKIAYEGIMK